MPDKLIDESIDSTPPRRTVNRVAKPPTIKSPLGSFEESNGEKEDPLAALKVEVAALKVENNNLKENCAEAILECMDLQDKFDILRKSLCAKVHRLAKECGRPDLYDPPN